MRKLVILSLGISALLASATPSRTDDGRGGGSGSEALQSQTQISAAQFPRGLIVERVATRNDPAQSYALYLPSSYTPEKKWPILYCLDPVARGGVPVEHFRVAAEKHGWIVAGSHNSRNGPLQPSLQAAAAMWEDTHARLSLDTRRVYATGFSGGARLAVRFGYLCRDCLAGVIAHGAGFPPDIKPTAAVPFPIYTISGTDDFNFPELQQLDEALSKFNIQHRLAIFDGAHTWAPAEACLAALEWMELQAMKAGRRPHDARLLEEFLSRQSGRAKEAEASGKYLEAYQSYQTAARDFRGLRDVSEFERKAAGLKAMKEVGRALDEESEQVRRQQQIVSQLHAILEKRQDHDNAVLATVEFRHAVAHLKKSAQASVDTSARRVARRALNQLFAEFYEGATNLLQRREDYALAASTLALAAEIAPDNPRLYFELAVAHARNRDRKKALDALRKAFEKGFRNVAELSREPAFDALRGETAYQQLLNSIGSQP